MAEISVIIPVYNVEKYLHRCLDCLLNQTFHDWTAICVDDGSSDNCGKILDEYAKKDKRFVVIHKENGGLSAARNEAMKKVKTPYVMFLDSDDCIHPQAFEIVYNLAKEKNTDIVSFRYLRGDASADIPGWFDKRYDVKNIKTKTTNHLLYWATNRDKGMDSWYVQQCVVWRNLYKTDLIKNIKCPENICVLEDFVFWSRVLFKTPTVCIIKLPLYSYTANPGSILHTADYIKSVKNLIAAVGLSYQYMVSTNMSWLNRRRWKSRFMWDILSRVYVYAKQIDDKDELRKIKSGLLDLKKLGVFDNVPDFHAWRYRRRIEKLISQIS